MKRIVSAILLMAVLASAQQIKAIKFDGLIHLSSDIAKEIIGIHPGEPIDIEKVDEAIKRLFAQGYFKDIWVTEERGVLTFHFKEKPVISQISFVGYGENKKEELLSQLGLKKGDIYDEGKIEKAEAALRGMIEAEGYFDTVVETEVTPLENGSVKVEFLINKGENIIIKKLNLCGAEHFDQSEIESVMANREREFMGWMWGLNDGKVKIDQLKYEAPRIRDFYMRHGYLDAKVENPLLRVDFNQYRAILDFKIEEGSVYRVKDVEIDLLDPVIDVDLLKEDLRVDPGEVFNIDDLRKDMENIKEKIANLGYAYVRVIPDFKKDEQAHTAIVQYKIFPGKKVYIRDVIIAGNTRTLDRVVRREVFLAPGDTYNLTDLKDSKAALMRTGYFENVIIDERRVSEDKMDLVVNVKETQTGNIMLGGGYGSYDGFIINASINDRNVFGSGLSMGLSVDFSRYRSNFNFNITNPRIFDSDYSTGFNIYNSEYESYDYTEKRKGGSVTVGRQIARYWHAGLMYQYFDTQLTGMNTDYPDYDLYNDTTFATSAITPSLRFNNTDDYYLPRHGMIFGISAEYAGIGGDAKYNKNYMNFSIFHGMDDYLNYDLILRYKARLGAIPWDEKLPINEKFFMGGIRTVRGYQSGSISAKDDNGYLLGGKYTFSNSVEASIPLVEAAKMRLAFFFDYGMIGEDSFTEEKRAGTGAVIEWFSPMGPISLIFARPLMEKEGDQTSSFEFTMGTQF
ncbi:outer membrane protein assembly factor BamA [Hydrogenimonas cancrithermarum]|uniref:Outer membrane protein assembly factor BamA n=1 Tax=Hydrogenimonas cancrithermarum TaxID=2993563 RepID=A0ABM8FJS2_9BACT|nr:outer membrane protein assembly factor BamA [Hydrogenimonas cancrithermarum]BDY12562.1 outer membrane protein assembly factor BamA [Hydrogenimonas cancrithermarum]